ncbi:TPA: hypothetical protein DCY65_02375 [Candidatus Acetothermia bacterium]|nr:hypothetical protein [Candidatus Acetothermia bacterium]
MTRTRLLLLGGLLVVVLGLLAAGLAGIEFRGGTRGPGPTPTPPGAPGEQLVLPAPAGWILDVIAVVFLILLGARVLMSLLSRRARQDFRRLLPFLVLALGALLLLMLIRPIQPPQVREETEEVVAPDFPGLSEGPAREEAPPPRAPRWAVYLVAGIIGAGLALWAVRRFLARPPSPAAEIRAAVSSASAELAQGLPVSDVVICCWLRMVAVLSQRAKGADAPAVTPRELAERLVRLGFREESVLVLTKLFEEVRYGHKETEPRRGEALAALAAIERVYG